MGKLALRAIKQLFCASGGLVSLGCALCVLWASTGLARAQDRAAQTGFTLSETSPAAWVLRFDAAISPALAQDIDAFADRFALLEQRPVLIVLLGSSGGDAYAAMQIGTRLRALDAHVFVTSSCDSACLFVLASGVFRSAPAFSVGIHRAQVTRSSGAPMSQDGSAPIPADTLRDLMGRFERDAVAYLGRMGVDPGLVALMQGIDTTHVRRLSEHDLIARGVIGLDAEYRAAQAARLVPLLRDAPTPDETAALIRSIGSHCGLHFGRPAAFADCHLRRLFVGG